VPRSEILTVSELLATKLVENEFAAYLNLQALMASENALSKRGFTIASYALCGFANLGSLGIQIGVLSALAPSRTLRLPDCPDRRQCDDLWFYLGFTSCWNCVSVVSILYVSIHERLCVLNLLFSLTLKRHARVITAFFTAVV
jgi:hypothetical protein